MSRVSRKCAKLGASIVFHSYLIYSLLSSGIKLIFLPPYSPDYNPTEECFSFVKAYIRRNGHIYRDIVESGDKAAPFHFLYEALDKIPAAAARGWFHNSGYV
jgi:transposase